MAKQGYPTSGTRFGNHPGASGYPASGSRYGGHPDSSVTPPPSVMTPDQIFSGDTNFTVNGQWLGTTAPYVSNVQAQQVASVTSGRVINSDSFAIYSQDLLHFTGAGMHAHGTALANLLLSVMA